MKTNTIRQRAFTLVELLIVIVVIAILASISVVAYNGIQNRAQASRAAAVVDGYMKLLEMYRIDHGYYPFENENREFRVCLGGASDFPAADGMAEGQCYIESSWSVSVDSTFNNLLNPYVRSMPAGDLQPVLASWGSSRGVMYRNDNEGLVPSLTYILRGDHDCVRGVKHYDAGYDDALCVITLSSSAI